ncbi:MAG: hypothetical protein RQ745_12660 [Longimicrobiales bacterium]|nr:hypothetical protein [Longimicrobiales bacterium]
MNDHIPEMPFGLGIFRRFALFVSAISGVASVFLLLVVFFAPGPVRINGQAVELVQFRVLGLAMAAGAAVVSICLGLSLVGLARRAAWFRTVVMMLATAILGGGVVANLIAGRADLAIAAGVLAILPLAAMWCFFFRNPDVLEYLAERVQGEHPATHLQD